MLGWLVIIAATIGMARIAENEGQSGALWGILTFACCFGCAALIPLPFINLMIGCAISFGALTLCNLRNSGQAATIRR